MPSSLNDLLFQCFVKASGPGTVLQVTAKSRGSAALAVSDANSQLAQAIVPSPTTNGNAIQVIQVANSGGAAELPPNDLWAQAFVTTSGGFPALQVTTGTFVGQVTGSLNENQAELFVAGPTGTALQVVTTTVSTSAFTGSSNDAWNQAIVNAGGGTTALQVVFV